MHHLLKPTVKTASYKMLPILSSAMPLFALGRIVMTPSAAALLERHRVNVTSLLTHYQAGNWGNAISAEENTANIHAVAQSGRILGVFRLLDETVLSTLSADEKRHAPCLLVLTNGSRSQTTVFTQRDV